MVSPNVKQLSYVILPGKPAPGFQNTELHDKAFHFWLEYWKNTCKETGMPESSINADDFLRHDYVNVLLHNEMPVAMINCTRLDFVSPYSSWHSYIKSYFGDEFLRKVVDRGLRHVLTMENIFAHPDWRSSKIGISLGTVSMCLALNKTREAGYDGAFGAGRADAPTAKIAYELGGQAIIPNLMFHGKPTDLIAWSIKDIKAHPDLEVTRLVNRLWSSRSDFTNTGDNAIKRAA